MTTEPISQCVVKQPNPFEKFSFKSSLNKRPTLESEVELFVDTGSTQIDITVDLYSKINPPLLSRHVLRQAESNDLFVTQQLYSNNGFFNFVLNNCHIWKKSKKLKGNMLRQKLRALKRWELGGDLCTKDEERIENIVNHDYYNVEFEKKVYLGFTPYIYDNLSNTRKIYKSTIFSNAIYDTTDWDILSPPDGGLFGGSEHKLKLRSSTAIPTTIDNKIRIMLSDDDNSWHVSTMGQIDQNTLHIIMPPYTGWWSFDDGNCLVNLAFLDDFEGQPKKPVKFIYT